MQNTPDAPADKLPEDFLDEAWHRVRGRLRTEIGEAAFRTWLQPSRCELREAGRLAVLLPTRYMRDRVCTAYSARIGILWLEEHSGVSEICFEICGAAPGENCVTAWGRVRSRLRAELGDAVYLSCFQQANCQPLGVGSVRITFPSRFLLERVRSGYSKRIAALWRDEGVHEVHFAFREAAEAFDPLPATDSSAGMPQPDRAAIDVPAIQELVRSHYGLRNRDMTSRERKRRVARPRQIAMFLAKRWTTLSLPDIGRYFNRDHTTVLHACRTIATLVEEDVALANDVELLNRALTERNAI